MNIIRSQQNDVQLNETQEQKVNRLYESYKRSSSKKDFLCENGRSEENELIWAFIGLNESVKDTTKRFTFENGMYIPGISPKVSGRLSLYSIAESASSAQEFVDTVSQEICESKLGFTPTERDRQLLESAYNTFKSMKS